MTRPRCSPTSSTASQQKAGSGLSSTTTRSRRSAPCAGSPSTPCTRCVTTRSTSGVNWEEPDVAVQLNHTIVWCRDQESSANFMAEMLGLERPYRFGPFLIVEPANGVSLDFHEVDGEVQSQHYAFLISEEEFDEVF